MGRGPLRRVNIIEEGKTKEVKISDTAYQVLLAVARRNAEKERISREELGAETGRSALSISSAAKELRRKIGSEINFPKGHNASERTAKITLLTVPVDELPATREEVRKTREKIKKETKVKENQSILRTFTEEIIHPQLRGSAFENGIMQGIESGKITKVSQVRRILKEAEKDAGIKRVAIKEPTKPAEPVFEDPVVQRIYGITREPNMEWQVRHHVAGSREVILHLESRGEVEAYKLVDYYLQLRKEQGMTEEDFMVKMRQLPGHNNPRAEEVSLKTIRGILNQMKPVIESIPIKKIITEQRPAREEPLRPQIKKPVQEIKQPGATVRIEKPAATTPVAQAAPAYGKEELRKLLSTIIGYRGISPELDELLRKRIESGEIKTKSQLRRINDKEKEKIFREQQRKETEYRKAMELKLQQEREKNELKAQEDDRKAAEERRRLAEEEGRREAEKRREAELRELENERIREEADALRQQRLAEQKGRTGKKEETGLSKKQATLLEQWKGNQTLTESEVVKRFRASRADIEAVKEFAAKQGIKLGK